MRHVVATALCASVGLLLYSPKAEACGGLFCSAGSPTPVDQNAERILFRVHDDGSVTAVVEIAYTGDPGDFSWIIPVPDTPVVDVVPAGALRLLDQATAPQFLPPPATCARSGGIGLPLGGFACDETLSVARPPVAGSDVDVTNLPRVGPYDDIVVVESDDENALVDWLNEHEYVVTPAMEPIIAAYVAEGSKFLALRLAADAGVSDIQPISFTCPPGMDGARIPLRLTAVSAEPEMGVLVFVAGPSRFQPASFRQVELDTALVQMHQASGQANYYPLLSWLVDQEGGRAFVTEYADGAGDTSNLVNNFFTTDEDRAWLNTVFGEHAYITRMYTRISGWEMTDDPVFLPSSGPDVARVHDLSTRPVQDICDGPGRVPCGDTYCGVDALCATTEAGVDGCVCPEGTVARQVSSPNGPTVFCQEKELEMLGGVDGLGDPCLENTCGENGRCQAVNGFPACVCDEGFAAFVNQTIGGAFRVRCSTVQETYPPEQLLWDAQSRDGDVASTDTGCASAPGQRAGSFFGFLALLFGAAFGLSRVLRRR